MPFSCGFAIMQPMTMLFDPSPEHAKLLALLSDAEDHHTRVIAGDTLRADLLREKRLVEADEIARQVIDVGTPYQANPLFDKAKRIEVYDALERAYITRGPNDFHCFLIALEWNRPIEDRFYQPRIMILKAVADDLTDMMVHDMYDIYGISMPPRVGKLLSDDTPVLTSDGWKNHGDLVVGDEVISPNGRFVPVTHVWPKAQADRLVTFGNGEQIQCHSAHEWVLHDRASRQDRVIETGVVENFKYVIPGGNGKRRYRFQLPHRIALDTSDRELRVDPYTLGVWLGDGTANKPLICGAADDLAHIVPHIAYAPTWHYVHQTTGVHYTAFETQLRVDLQSYGMCQSRNANGKLIPDEYLVASKRQRLELLAGLLDTDGSFTRKENRYHFTTASERLKDDVTTLVSTFGWLVSCRRIEPSVSSSGIVGRKPYYNLSFNPTEHIPCRLPRKQCFEFSKPRMVPLTNIEQVEPKQGNCISVEGGVYCVGRQLVPTHNSTLGIFFIAWVIGRACSSPVLAIGYAEKIAKMFYEGVSELYDDPVTYNYRNIFPLLDMVGTSAKDLTLDYRDDGGKSVRKYKSFTARSIDGQLTGATEARQLLYVDDLVEDIEEAMSIDRLNTLDTKLIANAQSRKKEGCKEVHIGTRWSLHDPMARLERRHEGNDRVKFITIPALDPETDESNFDYPNGVGFSTEHFRTLRSDYEEKNDLITWECVYQQNPVEREGLLFPADELTYVTALPPLEGEHGPSDRFAFCDVAFGGDDFLALPVAYQWDDGQPIIVDVVFLKGDYKITEPLVAGTIINHKVARAVFEANNGGDFYAKDITEALKKENHPCFIVAKRADSQKSKQTRIIQYSPDIKSFLFLDPKSDLASPMYRQFLTQLTTYTLNGKNKNDDAPDSLAGLAAMKRTNLNAKVETFDRRHI